MTSRKKDLWADWLVSSQYLADYTALETWSTPAPTAGKEKTQQIKKGEKSNHDGIDGYSERFWASLNMHIASGLRTPVATAFGMHKVKHLTTLCLESPLCLSGNTPPPAKADSFVSTTDCSCPNWNSYGLVLKDYLILFHILESVKIIASKEC